MEVIIAATAIMILAFIALVCVCCCIAGSRADQWAEQCEKMMGTCPDCGFEVSWMETEAIVKTDYGERHTLICPKCGKLVKIRVETREKK